MTTTALSANYDSGSMLTQYVQLIMNHSLYCSRKYYTPVIYDRMLCELKEEYLRGLQAAHDCTAYEFQTV